MTIWILAAASAVLGVLALRIWYRRWRKRRIEERRIVERPNSFYSSVLVRDQIDRQRWGKVDLSRVHPVNREEVERLLAVADVQGPQALTQRERLFLETMTELSFG
jgi:hypothetical protein